MATTGAGGEAQIVVPFPVPREQVPVATHYASRAIVTSLILLREHGYYEAYLRALPPHLHEVMLSFVPGSWVPMEKAIAHYTAIHSVGIPRDEATEIGAESAARLYSPMLVMAAKLAASAGVTPWTVMPKVPKSWEQTLRGSAVSIMKLGPKEGRFEIEGYPLADNPYIRAALAGILREPVQLFCKQAFVRELPRPPRPNALQYLVSWV